MATLDETLKKVQSNYNKENKKATIQGNKIIAEKNKAKKEYYRNYNKRQHSGYNSSAADQYKRNKINSLIKKTDDLKEITKSIPDVIEKPEIETKQNIGIGLKGAVATENKAKEKYIANVDTANKILEHERLLAEYKNKINELRDKIHPMSTNYVTGNSTSSINTKQLLSPFLRKQPPKLCLSYLIAYISYNKNNSQILAQFFQILSFKITNIF